MTVNLPNGTTTNDQIIVGATVQKSQTVTTPTGYTVVGTFTSGNPNTDTQTIVYRKTAQAGDTNVAITFGANIAKSITVAVYRGVNPNTPIDVSSNAGNDKVTSIAVPSVTTTAANERLVNIAGEANTTGTWTAPSGMTSRTTAAFGNSSTLLADQTITAAGATGTRTDTFSTKANLVGVLLALKPAATTYGYDARGNRTTITPSGGTATTLGYDQANRLTSYGATATYIYNGDGLREGKTISGTTTQQTWDFSGQLASIVADGATSYIYGPSGLPVEQINGTTTLYYQQDQLGSTRVLTDSAGNVAATYTFDAYGRQTGSTGSVATPFGFAGQYTDAESGLQYLRHRYYDSGTAQFLNRDPAVAATRAPYSYAAYNPLSYSDPTGLFYYTLNYDLGTSDLSASQFTAAVASDFGALFPIHGHASQLTGNGQDMNLSVAGIPFPVEVTDMTATGWKFDTQPPHPDYPGWINFKFSQTSDCHLHLRIHGYVPDYSGFSLAVGGAGGPFGFLFRKSIYRAAAEDTWGPFADNLRTFNRRLQ